MSNDAARFRDQRVGTPAPHECSAIDPFTDLSWEFGIVCENMAYKSLSLQGFGMVFDHASLGFFSCCITRGPCLFVNDGQK
jgi:hypothetical protein